MSPLVRAATLTNFLEVAHELGLNPLPLLREVGLRRALLSDPEQRIPADRCRHGSFDSGCTCDMILFACSFMLTPLIITAALWQSRPTG